MRIVLTSILATVFLVSGCAKRHEALTPMAALEVGWQEYRLGEFDRAVERFDGALTAAGPAGDVRLQAMYGLAATWNLRLPAQDQDKARAAELYQAILDEAPESPLAPWADLALARMKHLVPVGEDADYSVIQPAYERIIKKYPGHLVAREAFIYLMGTKVATLETNDLKEAIARLGQFVSETNDRSFFQPAYSLMAVSYNALGMQKERLEVEIASLDVTEVDPTNPYNEFSWQYWNIATIAEFELGDFETARAYYKKLLAEYPRDRRVYGAKQALLRMEKVEQRVRDVASAGGAP